MPKRYAEVVSAALFLWGGKGKYFPLVHARKTLGQIQDAKPEVISAAAHWIVWQYCGEMERRL
ncbi:MAG TPA: hypothetical protein ENJ82_00595 [Bacteroidetes bacterium]|nr:hypothetical protein [Bacteroidota bacterium]